MIKILNLFFVFCIICIQIKLNTASAPYSKCLLKQTPVKINDIEIEGCTSKKRCTVKQGTKAKITIKFTPDKDYKNIERVIFGIMNNGTDNNPDAVEVPFNKKKEGCGLISGSFAGGDCKKNGLQKGEEYTFVDIMEILPEYPKLSLTARYILREENVRGSTTPLDRKQKQNWKFHPGQTLFCLRIPLAIK